MDQTLCSACSAVSTHTLHGALELSKKNWLLAIQFPDREQPSLIQSKPRPRLLDRRSSRAMTGAKDQGCAAVAKARFRFT